MQKKYEIHQDFHKLPILPAFSPWLVVLTNAFLIFDRLFRKKTISGSFTNQKIIGLDRNKIPLTIIKPDNIPQNSPALIYYHGGAFAYTYAKTHFDFVEKYAKEANCCVIFVEYRLAPKFPFPCGFNDSYSALLWTMENADALGINKNKIAVGGDSSGGALAASVAQKAINSDGITLCGQLLIYPVTDKDCKTHSATTFTDTPNWKAVSNRRMWDIYLKDFIGKEITTYASPIHGNLKGLPAAYIELAEYDPLRDEGKQYALALTSNCIDVVLNEPKGTVHGYDIVDNSEITKKSLACRIKFLKQIFYIDK